jgi:hypothetical protein
VISARAIRFAGARPALAVGLACAFVAAVNLARRIGPSLLADPDSSWTPWRLLLGLAAAGGTGLAGGAAATLFFAWARTPAATEPLAPLPLRRATLIALSLAAVVVGTALRFWDLARVPEVLWVDDLSLIRPALELGGAPSDFADAIRATPYGVPRPYGSIGILYLEGYRAALRLSGTTVLGVRLPSALAGAASLVTAALLGRALLPAGGGMLTALILAGLRWHLILSRWAFNMIVLAPIVDLATLALLAARRRRSASIALAGGAMAGVGAHVYLSAWPASAALALFALWPAGPGENGRARVIRSGAFVLGFAACAAPLFLFREGRATPYFARTADHNVILEMRRERSFLPPLAAAADALASPWFLSDPTPRHDIPGRSRLGWLYGLPVAIALGRAFLRPREPLSGLLLAQGAASLAAIVAGGQADNPNGSRFGYLSTLAAVAASAGVLWLVGRVPAARRRAAAVTALGVVAVGGVLSARDALITWSSHPETFGSFHGEDTLIGRAAARWDSHGALEIAPGLGHSRIAVDAVRRYRLDPDLAAARPEARASLQLRIVPGGTVAADGERIVERVEDSRGRTWAVVLARRAPVR